MSKTRKQDASSGPSTGTPEFYTRQEAAALLRMSLATFDRRVEAKRISVSKRPGGRVLLSREQMYAALEARRRGDI